MEQVDEMYNEVSSAHASKHWKPSKSFKERASVAGQGGVVGNDEKVAVDHDHSPPATTGHHEDVAPTHKTNPEHNV